MAATPSKATDDRTVRGLLAAARRRLGESSPGVSGDDPGFGTPRLDAEALLEHCCGIGRTAALTHPERLVSEAEAAAFSAAVERRLTGEPVAYICGHREFYALPLRVGPAVLVPRPETELVVDAALELTGGGPCRVVDLGTGSGAIALALKRACPAADVIAVDVDPAALAIARQNAEDLDIDVTFAESSWFDALGDATFDIVVSNPPYVRSDDAHFDGPLHHEPRLALDGGADGLDCYRRLLDRARRHLRPGASVVLEHGYDQREALIELATALGYRAAATLDDLAGLPRVLVLDRQERG